jgi:hypothetical protein
MIPPTQNAAAGSQQRASRACQITSRTIDNDSSQWYHLLVYPAVYAVDHARIPVNVLPNLVKEVHQTNVSKYENALQACTSVTEVLLNCGDEIMNSTCCACDVRSS